MILHIDMDAFFASIEQVINPKLKGKPLIVGSRANKLHTVVCAASYEAKAYGIDSGMSSQEAFKLCPDLEFVSANQSKYIWTSEQIFELLKGYGFEVVYASIDEFQMDITYAKNPEALAQSIQKQIQETFKITASIGIAKNCLLAKLASKLRKPNGIVILNPVEETLRVVPVKKLCGVGEKTEILFLGMGIRTCLDLYQKSAQFLKEILGQNGLNLYLSLHSTDHFEATQEDSECKSIGHSYTLPKSTENIGFIQAWMRLLSEMIGRRLRQNNMAARTIHLWLSCPEMANFSGQKTYKEPTNDSQEIFQKALKILPKIGQKTPKIRALAVTCSNLSKVHYPPLLKEEKRREALIKAVDCINNRIGDWSIYPAIIQLAKKSSQ